MKATTLCLLVLLFVAQAQVADWTGTWYHSGGSDSVCCPAGLLTIAQKSNGMATIEGKWDSYSTICKRDQLAGKPIKVEIQAEGNKLEFISNVGTKTTVTLTRKDNGESDIRCNSAPAVYVFSLLKKDSSTKFEDWTGSYTLTPMTGADAQCCFPESVVYKSPEETLYYSNIKWSDSDACKVPKINGQEWSEVHTGVVVPSSPPEVLSTKYFEDKKSFKGYAHKYENGSLIYNSWVDGVSSLTCLATMERGKDVKSWTGIIIGVVVAVLVIVGLIVGYLVYRKKQGQAALSHETDYGRMVGA